MPQHSYASAERFILSREFFGLKLGLQNIGEFLQSIGKPQSTYRTVHIAGTNGKGSTAAMMAAILQAQGYKTGLFTSPHLVSLRERVRVNGRYISKPSVVAFVDRHRPELARRKLSFFEVVTAMAFYYFNTVKVDVAIIETGLGGRLDATNVLTPELTITTDISRDHVEILGTNLWKIAGEKAGIIKNGTPHLAGMLPPAAERVIRNRCLAMNAPFHQLTPGDFAANPTANQFDFQYNGLSLRKLRPVLFGPHQLKNAALTVKAMSLLNESGLSVGRRAIREGLARTVWPGRFQLVQSRRQPALVFDVCHNVGGVRAFVESFKLRFPRQKTRIITGFVKRKEHQKMFDLLRPIAREFHIVPLATGRTVAVADIIRTVNWHGADVTAHKSLRAAYKRVEHAATADDIVCVIGSHFLVGEFFDIYSLM